MRRIGYYIKIYLMIVSQYLKERLQFRADFAFSILGMILINIAGMASFWVIFNNINALAGWSYEEMMFLYGFSLVAMSPQQLFLDNAWRLSHMVVTGDFIRYCFRPVNILFYYMSEVIDVKGFSQLGLGSIILIWSWNRIGITNKFYKYNHVYYSYGVISSYMYGNDDFIKCTWLSWRCK